MMDEDMSVERSAARSLDQIRQGGQALMLVAKQRLKEIEQALEEGRFIDAMTRAQELVGKLHPLAEAENYLSVFADTFVLRADEVTEGMVLHNVGRVTEVSSRSHDIGEEMPCVHVQLSVEGRDKPVEFPPDRELVISRDAASSAE
jgi:hypothetical protein